MNTDRYSQENDHAQIQGSLIVMDSVVMDSDAVFARNDDEDHAIEDDPELQP